MNYPFCIVFRIVVLYTRNCSFQYVWISIGSIFLSICIGIVEEERNNPLPTIVTNNNNTVTDDVVVLPTEKSETVYHI